MLTGFNNRSYKYISKNRMRFIFLLIKRFSGGVVGEPGFPTIFIRFRVISTIHFFLALKNLLRVLFQQLDFSI